MTKATLPPERLAELLRRYPHEPNKTLAAEFGLTTHKVGNLAFNNGVRKTADTISRLNGSAAGIAIAVLALAKAAGAQGISRMQSAASLPHLRASSICNALHLATERGQLHRAGRRRQYRWFSELQHALAHNASVAANGTAIAAAPAPRGPANVAGQPNETAATRRTVWQAPAAPAFTGGVFSALPPGCYLDERAKPWVAAANTKGQQA